MNSSQGVETRHPDLSAWRIVAIGVVSFAMATGIGRFAFTALLPLMIRDGTLTVVTGAEWATANYVGYLIGALSSARFSADPMRGLRLSMVGVTIVTLAIALISSPAANLAGLVLRLAAGIFTGWATVCASSWCLTELARRQAANLSAWIFSGSGLGIVLSGMTVWLGGRQPASWLWIELGLMVMAATFFTNVSHPSSSQLPAAAPVNASAEIPAGQLGAYWPMVLCYGIFGFGYIIPATFLPVMAQRQMDDPLVFGMVWPIFGAAAALSGIVSTRWLGRGQANRIWSISQGLMGLGTALPIFTQSLWALAVSGVLMGCSMTAAASAAMMLARKRVPGNPTPLLARMTAALALGQIIGPLLVRTLGTLQWAGWDAVTLSLALASLLFALSTVWIARYEKT